MPVQAIALGDQLTILALSGEVVVDYAIRLQKELGGEGKTLWVAAYAQRRGRLYPVGPAC